MNLQTLSSHIDKLATQITKTSYSFPENWDTLNEEEIVVPILERVWKQSLKDLDELKSILLVLNEKKRKKSKKQQFYVEAAQMLSNYIEILGLLVEKTDNTKYAFRNLR